MELAAFYTTAEEINLDHTKLEVNSNTFSNSILTLPILYLSKLQYIKIHNHTMLLLIQHILVPMTNLNIPLNNTL